MNEQHDQAVAHVIRRLGCGKAKAVNVVKVLGERVLEFDDPQALANAIAAEPAKPISKPAEPKKPKKVSDPEP